MSDSGRGVCCNNDPFHSKPSQAQPSVTTTFTLPSTSAVARANHDRNYNPYSNPRVR
jgi:hypothetical protein